MSELPKATGHTALYGTLARALGYAAGSMEDDFEELADVGASDDAASLRLEARFVTVTLLAASLAECLGNTALSLATDGNHPALLQKRPMPLERWTKHLPEVLGCDPFVEGKLKSDLALLIDVRNAITHASPELFVGDRETVARGNARQWDQLNRKNVRMFVGLPHRLVQAMPRSERLNWPMEALADDYWLSQSLHRGRGERGRSGNMWRPETKESRLCEAKEKRLR